MATSTAVMRRVTQVATGVAGSPYYLTAYFDSGNGTAQTNATNWRNLLSGGVSTYVAPLTFLPITEVARIDPTTGDLVGLDPVTVAQQVFTGAGDPLPAATSLLLRWRTGEYVGGREIRGRTNIPRMQELDNTGGVPSATLVSTWAARLATFLAASDSIHVVWSPKNGVWAPTTSNSVWAQWAVLRSRRD